MAGSDPSLLAAARSSAPVVRRARIVLPTLAACMTTYFVGRLYLDEMAARALSIFVLAIVFWATEVLPLFATAFTVIGIEIVALAHEGGLARSLSDLIRWLGMEVRENPAVGPVSASSFLGAFAQDTVLLLMGGFLLARAVSKSGVDREVARRVLRPFASSPRRLLWVSLGLSAFFSMWMSNTAATALMIAMSRPLASREPSLRGPISPRASPRDSFGANIGGIGTPIGTPPNAIAFGALRAAG